jgi:hypothetical protein
VPNSKDAPGRSGFDRAFVALALLASVAGCTSTRSATPEEFEAELRARLTVTVEGDGFVLHSPYGAEATEPYAAVLRRELGVVRRCFADASAEPVRVYLAPVPEADAPAPEEIWRHASRGGLEGFACETRFAVLWVRPNADAAQALVQAGMGSPQLRHELAHLATHRAGLAGKTWFNEGVARHVEHAQFLDGEMRPHPFPATLVKARDEFVPGDVARLLAWSLADERTVEEHASRYAKAEALLRFLLERSSGSDFVARLRAVRALDEESIAALEPEWRAWLQAQDALAAVRRELAAPFPELRNEGANLLPELAEVGARELLGEDSDTLALVALRDPETFDPAARFLVFFRARALRKDALLVLEASRAPGETLLAAALRARRGEPFDLERARKTWEDLDSRDRSNCYALAHEIPGLLER